MRSDHEDRAQLKYARKTIEKDLAHRREKLWRIFSWAGTLLIAIIGGVVAIKTDPSKGLELSWSLKGVLLASVFVLTFFSREWLRQNINKHNKALRALNNIDRLLEIDIIVDVDEEVRFGYISALLLLASAAVVATLINV